MANLIFFTSNSHLLKPKPISPSFPTHLGPFPILSVRDLTLGVDTNESDGLPCLPISSSSQMITFRLSMGEVTIRGSGTEPKLKYYCEIYDSSQIQAKIILKQVVEGLREDCIRWKDWGLEDRLTSG